MPDDLNTIAVAAQSGLQPTCGPFPLEGYMVFTDILEGIVRLKLRLNGTLTTVEMHPDHACALGRMILDAAIMQWMAWNVTAQRRDQ